MQGQTAVRDARCLEDRGRGNGAAFPDDSRLCHGAPGEADMDAQKTCRSHETVSWAGNDARDRPPPGLGFPRPAAPCRGGGRRRRARAPRRLAASTGEKSRWMRGWRADGGLCGPLRWQAMTRSVRSRPCLGAARRQAARNPWRPSILAPTDPLGAARGRSSPSIGCAHLGASCSAACEPGVRSWLDPERHDDTFLGRRHPDDF